MSFMQNSFSLKTLGCKLNQYESSLIAGQFLENGWVSKPFGESVDLVIVNTCTVTNKSDKKCRNYIRQGANFSKTGKVLVTGCMAERDADYLSNIPEVFAVVKNSDKEKIYSLVKNFTNDFISIKNNNNTVKNIITPGLINQKEYPLPFYRTRGLLKIQDGCDGECSYCIVPAVRGKPVSRDFTDILNHAKRLIDSDCPELIFTGITIGKYNSHNQNLADLIKRIADINGNFRVRITSIEPNHVSDDLINILSHEKICSHIHLPLQSGSDIILKSMKRHYSISNYIRVVEKIRKVNNDIALGTDIIIGFPEESEEDFNLTLKLVEEVKFAYVHQFTFSQRSGTPASRMRSCPVKEILERSVRLRELSAQIGLNYRKKFLGKNLLSIIEKNKSKNGFKAVSSNYIKMEIDDSAINNDITGKIINVCLKSVSMNQNIGVL